MKGLTKRQREIVDFIESYVSEKRHSPSYRDIQTHFSFSSLGSVFNHVRALKKKGILPEDTQSGRSLALLSKDEGVEIPLIGSLRGGMPIETYPQVTSLRVPSFMAPSSSAVYFLRVMGPELEEEGIQEGDMLLVQSQNGFEEGEMIVVLVGGQTTFIKRGFYDSPYLRLESTNRDVEPLILREDHVRVLGKILSLIRYY